ncbi:hypothetical protein [Methylocella silvestris]|nr:hypothetical protein [Methylocella silvestris]
MIPPPPVTPVPLLANPDGSVRDKRFAINPDATQIVFERPVEA